MAPSRNLSPAEKPYTDVGMNSTITDQRDQTENPTCSAATDQIRLRRAMNLLPASHATESSGSQSEIWWERPILTIVIDVLDHARNPLLPGRFR